MIALGLTTSSARGGAALCDAEGRVLGLSEYAAEDDHAARLFGAIDEAVRQAGVAKTAIGLVACDVGPGSFTGVRAGTAAAQSIAWALGVPAAPVTSLSAMAFGARRHAGDRPVLAVLDARRGEAFYAIYRDARRPPLVAPALVSSTDGCLVADAAVEHGAVIVGAFADALPGLPNVFHHPASDLPSASEIAALAHELAHGALDPVYVRKPDAKTEAERAASRV